jgi:hypothetical protein
LNLLRLLPTILSFLLLGAHFYRAGIVWLAAGCIAVLFLLFVKQPWVARITQGLLILGALEWLLTLYRFASMRIAFGEPWARLAVILGAIAVFTAISALIFQCSALKSRYRLNGD